MKSRTPVLATSHPKHPLIFLTERNERADRIRGLELAPSITSPPFDLHELAAGAQRPAPHRTSFLTNSITVCLKGAG
jgi:DNA-binding response OmpR family regulator